MTKTLFDKLWDAHAVTDLGGGSALIYIDRVFLHERTGSVALLNLAVMGRSVQRANQAFGTMDHIVDTFEDRSDKTTMPGGTDFITEMRKGCVNAGIRLFDVNDPDQGIAHVISPENGIVLPGLTLVCPDSHTCTQGAFGALAWGIGSTEAEHALATRTLRVAKPKTMRVSVDGELANGVTAKDLILYIIGKLSAAGAVGHAVEFAGSAITAMDMEARMTLCNMGVEFSAFTSVIAPDEKTIAYLKGRKYAPKGDMWDAAVEAWADLKSDEGAVFDKDITIDAADVPVMVTWGNSPQHAVPAAGQVPDPNDTGNETQRAGMRRALDYMDIMPGAFISDLKIDAAFIGSCTNSRISDLRRAASVLKGQKVADGVKAICVPGSFLVKAQAEEEGLDQIFKDAGFEWRKPGCSMCFFAGGEHFGHRERVVTTTNRNFESRQGPETRSHLASPETVAASAIAGRIVQADGE